jgi:hypothetical protein
VVHFGYLVMESCTPMVKLLQPNGEPDMEIVSADRKLRGLPPSEMVWVCQHSCAQETIPDCQDFNCEGTLIVDQGDVEDIRDLVARGELAAFDRVDVELKLDVPRNLGAALQRLVRGAAEMPAMTRRGQEYRSAGSLLAFARLCARLGDLGLSDPVRGVLREIEQVLTWEFSCGGPALFQQRFVDLRTRPDERGNTITLLSRADWPARALVAWEQPALRWRRRNVAPPARPEANAGFGLWAETGVGICMGRVDSGLGEVPGDLYAPRARLVFYVDQEVVDRVRGLCEAQAAAPPAPPLDKPMLALLEAITGELGLAIPVLPPASGREESACVRPAQFIRSLLLAQPHPPVTRA